MILIVEDEIKIADILDLYLKKEGFETKKIHDGAEVISFINKNKVDLVLLDIMLPNMDGITLCRKIKAINDNIIVIMLSAKDKENDKINGFEIGADDYVCKPFSPKEVIARVKARLKNNKIEGVDILFPIDNLKIILSDEKVIYFGIEVILTPVEYKILLALVKNPKNIISRDKLLYMIYDDKRIVGDRTIDTHIKNVRKKFNEINKNDKLFKSVYKRGYKFLP